MKSTIQIKKLVLLEDQICIKKDFSGYAVEKRKKTNQGYAEFA